MKLHNEQLIKKWEALRLEAYLPTPNDVWTIGWGHTDGVKPGMTITKGQAERFFREDIAWAEEAVNNYVTVGLNQHQFDALVSFVFNVGAGAFRNSTLLKKLNVGDYDGAAEEFPRWKYQDGKVLKGLVRRRSEEMEYFLTSDAVETADESVKPDEVEPMKSLFKSKELLAGLSALLTGGGSFMASLGDHAQTILSVGLCVALVGFGAFIIWNRVKARKDAKR